MLARDTLARWRLRCDLMPLSDFIWLICRESGFYAWCGTWPEGTARQANLRMLAEKAQIWEQYGRTGLWGFLQQMDEEATNGNDTSAHVLSPQDDLVRIMTIHKSKGLEFPVVFLMRAA